MYKKRLIKMAVCITAITSLLFTQEAPIGSAAKVSGRENKALEALKGTVSGKIVWSSSRSNSKHDIWIMNADGTDKKALTKSDNVDWFPRFSPDGSKVLFVRSKGGWVPEVDAKYYDKWDLWTVSTAGGDEEKVFESACWGTWRPDGKSIVFAQGNKAFMYNLETQEKTLLLDGDESIKKGTIVQEPNLSPNGKYLAATLRGSSRETGIWHLEKKEWYKTGGGCQIDWFPTNDEIYRMNPTGNGGTAAPSEVLAMKLDDGKPVENIARIKKFRLMDLPGKRSHEYFPKFDPKGEWMTWCATAKGHDHDIYDYEVYIWKRGTDTKKATRLTFHTGNDRWPDVYIQ